MANIFLKKTDGSSAIGSEHIKTFSCAISVVVGDIVYPSTGVDNFVAKNINNTITTPSVGIIMKKNTSTTCEVLLYGPCDLIISGLVRGKNVFLGISGTLTTTVPTDGYLQNMGICYENNKAFINPHTIRLKLN